MIQSNYKWTPILDFKPIFQYKELFEKKEYPGKSFSFLLVRLTYYDYYSKGIDIRFVVLGIGFHIDFTLLKLSKNDTN